MLERRREPRLSWNCTAPPSETIQRPPRSADWGLWQRFETWLAGSQPVRVAGSRPQGPVGQVSRGLGAGPPGLGAWGLFPTKTSLGAVREKGRGFSPSPPSATIQHAPQGRRIVSIFFSIIRYNFVLDTICGIASGPSGLPLAPLEARTNAATCRKLWVYEASAP